MDPLAPSPLALAQGYPPSLSPPGLFLTGDDHLRLTTFNAATGVTLAIEGRQFIAGHGLVAFAERHVPNTDRTSATSHFRLGEGWLLDVQIRASAGTPRRGQCFAILEIVHGQNNGSAVPVAVLVQGYVTDTQRRGWPRAPIEMSSEGRGAIRSIAGTNPAAGAEIVETVPTNARWLLLALFATLVTDATAANREPSLLYDDGTTPFFRFVSGVNQTATQTIDYSWSDVGVVRIAAQSALYALCLPVVHLPGGFRIQSLTANLQAGDNWGAPQLLVEEWIED